MWRSTYLGLARIDGVGERVGMSSWTLSRQFVLTYGNLHGGHAHIVHCELAG